MPGKVNPVIPEAVLMACVQVMGNDSTIALAGHSGNFQLSTMLPLIGNTLLQSIHLLSTSSMSLADKVVKDMQVNQQKIEQNLLRNPMLITALTSLIGYDKSAEIAQLAYQENRTILDVAKQLTNINEAELISLLDPKAMIGK